MRRTFDNIISNAVKYSQPNTKVTIDYEVVEGNHVFTVHDRGIGIPKDEQHKVFGGSYRASNAVKLSAIGTGMGLYLSRNVVEQHHGKLWLSSKEGEGTTVYIQLPK
jgi:two-component system sensor histidine kinase VicK